MDLLALAIQLVALSGSALCVFACMRHANDAHEEANELRNSRARVIALEHQLEALSSGVNKLRGKFYATLQHQEAPVLMDGNRQAPELFGGNVCENWLAAQLEGPQSKCAKCDCAYCTTQRAARAATKAAILAERNRKQPVNGGE